MNNPVRFWKAASFSLLAVVIVLSALLLKQNPETTKILKVALPKRLVTAKAATDNVPKKIPFTKITISKGDSLASLFLQNNLHYADLIEIIKLKEAKNYLLNLRPNQAIYLQTDKNELLGLKLPIDSKQTLVITRNNNNFSETIQSKPIVNVISYKSGVVEKSLYEAAIKSGLTESMYLRLVHIFQGDISFTRNIHPGDRFSVLYNEEYVDGKEYRPGNIVAAEFLTQQKKYQAFYYKAPNGESGYYDATGQAIKPMFLFPPVKYKRISGHFSYHRYDPVIHVIRPHLGIDYAAYANTPIHSVGNGKVIFVGQDEGYGNAVIVRYSRKYKALYGHMRRFARGIHAGTYVKQGQVIGYVGETGWATGPHLHFELYAYGIPKNPLKLHFRSNKSVDKKYLAQYKKQVNDLLTQLKVESSGN